MEEKVAIKKLLEVEERPYNHNTDPLNKMEEPSVHNNTLGSTHLTLSLNNSEQLPHQIQGLPLTQMGMLRIKLEEAKKENENLKAMLNQVNENCIAIQHRLLLAMQQHEQSSSPRNNHDLQMGNRQDAEKAVLSTRQFLNIGEPSPSDCSKTDGLALSTEKIMGKKLAYDYNIEGEINSQITSEETKRMKDQASEVTCRKARVAIRARSDFSLMGDGCQWRKYGQKTAKGNPCPRAYYRCSMGTACPVRKQVQRCFKDENVLMTTYEGKHNHPLPPAARPMANSTSAALNMFLSGSTTSLNGTSLSNSLFSSLSSHPSTAFASFSPSATCPTVTLDFTQPNNNYLQFQIATSPDQRQTSFPLPLHGYPQTSKGFNLSSNLPTFITPEKNLALVDVVNEAIAKDPSLKATLLAAISSLTRDPQNINNHSQPSKSGYDPCSKMPAMQPHQPYTPQLIER